jgi:uncharacterized protein DUF4262
MTRQQRPSVSHDPFLADTAGRIRRHGFTMTAVGFGECAIPECDCGPDDQAWAYTIGMVEHGLAELVITGLAPVHCLEFATHIFAQFRAGLAIPSHQRQWLGLAPFILRSVPEQWLVADPSRMATWVSYYGRRRGGRLPDVAQVVWGDATGRFPGDPLCDPFIAADQTIITDDPLGFPSRRPRNERRELRRGRHPGHRRSA